MAKTACEEAAELHEEFARDINPKDNGAAWVIARHKARAKRLRAEGRELKRLRREREKSVLIPRYLADFLFGLGELEGVHFGEKPQGARGNFWWRSHFPAEYTQPKARIQKARKK